MGVVGDVRRDMEGHHYAGKFTLPAKIKKYSSPSKKPSKLVSFDCFLFATAKFYGLGHHRTHSTLKSASEATECGSGCSCILFYELFGFFL